jgi:hypothetical protein
VIAFRGVDDAFKVALAHPGDLPKFWWLIGNEARKYYHCLLSTAHRQTFPRQRVPINCELESKLLHLCAIIAFRNRSGEHPRRNGLPGPILLQPSINSRQEIEQWQQQLSIRGFKPFHDPRWTSTFVEWFFHTCRATSFVLLR